MEMSDAVVISPGDKGSRGDDILGIVVLDCPEIAELTLTCCFVGDDIGRLHVQSKPFWFVTHEVDFPSL